MNKLLATLCPTCRKEKSNSDFAPFCSDRCRLIDLGAWASESYKVQGALSVDEIDDEEPIIN